MLHAENLQAGSSIGVPPKPPEIIGKVELASRLGWSRPFLDRRLKRDPRFPIKEPGSQGKGRSWQFDYEAVLKYLSAENKNLSESSDQESYPPTSENDDGIAASSDAQQYPVDDVKEGTARARRDMAQAKIFEDKLARDRGELVHIEDMRQTASLAMMHLGKGLDALPNQIVDRLGLSPEHALTIRSMINELRTMMVTELQSKLKPNG